MKYYHYICIITTITLISCELNTPPENENKDKQWNKVSILEGLDVKGFKIINNELYVYGWREDGGLYKTLDGNKWEKINLPDSGNFKYGISAVTMVDGDLIVASAYSFDNKFLYRISSEQFSKIPTQIPIDISDMNTINDNIILVPNMKSKQYYIGVLNPSGKLQLIADSVYSNPYVENECYLTNGIRETGISKLIKKDNNTEFLLAGELIANHFIVKINSSGYHCFNTSGITTTDKFTGAYDLIWNKDTLFAATKGYVKYYFNDLWEIYGDSLPIYHGTLPIATGLTFSKKKLYISTTNDGILTWNDNEWKSIGSGLPKDEGQNVYPGISYIISFKDKLFIGYGSEKVWDTGIRGVWMFKID